MEVEIKVGDTIIPGPNNGLGKGQFKVVYIDRDIFLFPICIEDATGQRWWIRREGIKVIR